MIYPRLFKRRQPPFYGREVDVMGNNATMRPYLLRPDQAAAYIGLSARTLHRRVVEGLIPVVRTGDRPSSAIAFRVKDLEEFADTRLTSSGD